jgi:hypothetical protein
LVNATTNKKFGNKETARKQLQQIVALMQATDDVSIKAATELEALKR